MKTEVVMENLPRAVESITIGTDADRLDAGERQL